MFIVYFYFFPMNCLFVLFAHFSTQLFIPVLTCYIVFSNLCYLTFMAFNGKKYKHYTNICNFSVVKSVMLYLYVFWT